jgi:glycolate oxidase FAD binding subunit
VSSLESLWAEQYPGVVTVQLTYPFSERDSLTGWVSEQVSSKGIEHGMLVHAGSGTSLLGLLLDGSEESGVEVIEQVLKRCWDSGGNLVLKRAPASMKGRLPMWGQKGSDFHVMKRLKEELDPFGIMSPGRFIGGL